MIFFSVMIKTGTGLGNHPGTLGWLHVRYSMLTKNKLHIGEQQAREIIRKDKEIDGMLGKDYYCLGLEI